ncbi:MAG: hypothetical protein K2X48_01355 [Chitinophagaceae bacterium]|nr:hypothetical protein [Chitinophagaceae bacterium]
MQKIIFTFSLLLIVSTIVAQGRFEEIQHYKKFKVQADMGYARPTGKGSKAGVLLALEPKINLSDKVSVGLRMEASAVARGLVSINSSAVSGEAGLGLAFVPTVDYYFTNKLVRPFVGAGGGIYNLVGVTASTSGGGSISIPAVTKLGGMLRAGVEVWHIRAGFHYNLIAKSNNVDNNYYGITIGIVFGGGIKDEYKSNDDY